MPVGGRAAAALLRQRVLESLGAEPEWVAGTDNDDVVCWTASLATTIFMVGDGPDSAPGLGVLNVYTPVATVGDMERALDRCVALNARATLSRWQVAPGTYAGEDGELLWLACSFVVGRLSQRHLESFAAWCVQQQVALATAQMAGDLPWLVGGRPCIDSVHETAPYRAVGNWNPVVPGYSSALALAQDDPVDALAAHLKQSFRSLRQDMLRQGAGTWYSEDPDASLPFWEVPATWQRPAGDYIRWRDSNSGKAPTAQVETALTRWGDAGNGLLLTMRTPSYQLRSDAAINQLNRLNESAPGATHWLGAWTRDKDELAYLVFLPASLLGLGIGWEFVMREVLLTFTRQAQLARRVVFNERLTALPDGNMLGQVGFEATLVPHGLAWGETGEGKDDPVSDFIDQIYERLVGDDGQWAHSTGADTEPGTGAGFAWLPHRLAQVVTAEDNGTSADPQYAGAALRVRVRTKVRVNVKPTDNALVTIAKLNATLSDSALVLHDDGTLMLGCELALTLPLTEVSWAEDIAIRQFITAHQLTNELAGLGEEAVGHPLLAGPRLEPDRLFEEYAKRVRDIHTHCGDDWARVRPVVALEAVTGQYPLPYRMMATADGGLDFSWRPMEVPAHLSAPPEVRVTLAPGAAAADPAWVIRSRLRVMGSEAARARWCNQRNAKLHAGPYPPLDPIMVGGWGLANDGECCLTMGLGRLVVKDDEDDATWKLGRMLGEAQNAVLQALRSAPETVRAVPLSVMELAFGLDMVRLTVNGIVHGTSNLAWATSPGTQSVTVLCGEVIAEVPVLGGGPALDLVYGELLASVLADKAWPWPTRDFPADDLPDDSAADVPLDDPEQGPGDPGKEGPAGTVPSLGDVRYADFGRPSPAGSPLPSTLPRPISMRELKQKLDEWQPEAARSLGSRADVAPGAAAGADGVTVRFMLASHVTGTYLVSCTADEANAEVERFNMELKRLKLAPGLNDIWR